MSESNIMARHINQYIFQHMHIVIQYT